MGTKVIAISSDDVTYYTLPGSSGQMNRDSATPDDTIFGQNYKSTFPAIITWGIQGNAVYKGFAGYQATVKKVGTATTMTAEACSLVSGKTYQITAAAHQIIDRSSAFTVFDNGVDHTADVVSIDFLFGKITFASTYTVTGPVTFTGKYFPVSALGSIRGFTLTQTAEAIDSSDYATVQANGGYATHIQGLQTVTMECPGVFNASNGLAALLQSRAEVIIEINPDGTGIANGSVARGFFRAVSDVVQGNVGALEEENVKFDLSVPIASSGPAIAIPFGWNHAVASPIPAAIKTALTAWQSASTVYAKYLGDGTNGAKGTAVVTSMTLTSSMAGINSFQVNLAGSGAPTVLP